MLKRGIVKRLIVAVTALAIMLIAAPSALADGDVVTGGSVAYELAVAVSSNTYNNIDPSLQNREQSFAASTRMRLAAADLEDKSDVDKSALEKAIKDAGDIKKADYPSDSWKTLQDALESAQAALDNKKAVQSEIDEAAENLQTAIEALEVHKGATDTDVVDAVISLTNANFDKKNAGNISVNLTATEQTLENLTCGGAALVAGADYSVRGVRYTINAEFLSSLDEGVYEIVFNMSKGADPVLTVTVREEAAVAPVVVQPPVTIVPFNNPYSDINENQWFYDSVAFAYMKGFMKGTSTEPMLFSPFVSTTRGMIVTIMYRIAGSPDVSNLNVSFNDVHSSDYYADAVKWGMSNGIIQGYGNGNFGPDENITREQLSLIVYRYELLTGNVLPNVIADIEFVDSNRISDQAKDAAKRLFLQGIITTKQGNIFEPTGLIARGELVSMLKRYIEAIQ